MKKRYQKFLLFPLVFFLGIFLFLLKPQTIFAWSYCNNGPSSSNSGGCGTACNCGNPWTQYIKDTSGSKYCETSGSFYYYISFVDELCPTGDVCRVGAKEKGLRMGYCDCSFGPIYKTCCVGSTPVLCVRYPGYKEVYQKGRCPPGSVTVNGTSCPGSGGGDNGGSSGGGSCVVDPYNGACPKTYVLSGGCCVCP